jgi:NAD(P)H-nitrite reductase large subunit
MAQGIAVSVVERNNTVLSSLVNEQGAEYIQNMFERAGGKLYTQRTVQKIIHTDERVSGVQVCDGTAIKADMVIVAVGIQPNLTLAQQLNLTSHETVGIAVDNYMRTSTPSIFAAGDIVVVQDQITGALVASRTWPDAMLQGITAAHAMAGQPKTYPGLATVISSSFFGIKFARFGVIDKSTSSVEVIDLRGDAFYHRFIVQDVQLKGFLLVGNTTHVGKFRAAVLTKSPVNRQLLAQLSMPDCA